MKKHVVSLVLVIMICLSSFGSLPVSAAQGPQGDWTLRGGKTPQPHLPITQLIVRFKSGSPVGASLNHMAATMALGAAVNSAAQEVRSAEASVSRSAGVDVQYFRPMSGEGHVFKLGRAYPAKEAQALADKVSQNPDVEYAEPDWPMQITMTPNDPAYTMGYQWDMEPQTSTNYGLDMPAAWDQTLGDPNMTIAVLDTGILKNHPDLYGRWVGGYDFITDLATANDGDGRDADASDPGDWITPSDCEGAGISMPSSWHGSHVSGTIAAAGNNGIGIIGVNQASKVLPVRVLGKCGGVDSDIVDAVRWAAGLPVPGVPSNPNPAKVLSLSLGGVQPTSCPLAWQYAINAATAAGSVMVVAAGNSAEDAGTYSPANCQNVITVGATDINGKNASYSNYGSVIDIWGPGGDYDPTVTPSWNLIISTVSSSKTSPDLGSYQYMGYQGTSMATPHISGLVSLMLAKNPGLTLPQIISVLQATSTPMNPTSTCRTGLVPCGAMGVANAARAIAFVSVSRSIFYWIPMVQQ